MAMDGDELRDPDGAQGATGAIPTSVPSQMNWTLEDKLPPVIPPASREPLWFTLFGLLFFCSLLAFIWINFHRQETSHKQPPILSAINAKANTYIVEMARYHLLRGDLPVWTTAALHTDTIAIDTARSWQAISKATNDTANRGLTQLNAAALYGAAGEKAQAHSALDQAITADRGHASVYLECLPLYGQPALPVDFSPNALKLIQKISAGPLLLAENAQIRQQTAQAIAVLRPGAIAGMRMLIVNSIIILLFGGLLITTLVLWLAQWEKITQHLTEAASTRQPDLPWGIGTALIVITLSFATAMIIGSLPVYNPTLRMLLRYLSTPIASILVIGLFLIILGHKPWAWGVLGWKPSRGSVRFGILSLILTFPLIWAISIAEQQLFHSPETHPLIPELFAARSPALVLTMVLTAIVLAPITEETLFRGMLFRAAGVRLPFWGAACLSGFLFASAHPLLMGLAPIAVVGILFAFVTQRTQSLFASAAAHAVFNGTNAAMILLLAWALRGPGS